MKLLDARVADLLLYRVKELEGYLDAKRKLGRSRPDGGSSKGDDDEGCPEGAWPRQGR